MKASDFANFYGVEVMLQFKETIALAVPGEGEPRLVPRFSRNGKPVDQHGNEVSDPKLMASQRAWPIAVAQSNERSPEDPIIVKTVPNFTYVLTGAVVLPVQGSELLSITYKSQDALVELMIDPELIIACQVVRARQEEQRLIAQA